MGSNMPLGLYCWKSWLCHPCKSFVGDRLQNSGTQLLLVLLIPFSVPFCSTVFMMPLMWDVVLRTFVAPLPLACSLLGIPCQVIAVLFLLWRLMPLLRLCSNNYRVLTVMD